MSTPSPSARAYRRLGYLALAHAISLFGFGFLFLEGGTEDAWRLRLWVALVTLWFFWPVALALHRGRSALRFAVFMLLATVVALPSLWSYNRIAPRVFGLPWVVSMNPWSMWQYYSAYRAGEAQARKDIAAGILVIEESGLGAGGGPEVQRILLERYHIELRAVAGCVVDESIIGHEAGYNAVSEPEIDRRFGRDRVDAAREEGYQLQREQYAREEQSIRDLTKRLSSIPPDAKVITELIRPYLDNLPEKDSAAEQELAQFVKAVEKSVVDAVPEETPSFKLHVIARLAPKIRPSFEMSGSLNSPRPAWQAISNNLDALPSPEWNNRPFSIAFDFLIQPPH